MKKLTVQRSRWLAGTVKAYRSRRGKVVPCMCIMGWLADSLGLLPDAVVGGHETDVVKARVWEKLQYGHSQGSVVLDRIVRVNDREEPLEMTESFITEELRKIGVEVTFKGKPHRDLLVRKTPLAIWGT
jgi:hypothetical protein